MAPIPDNVQWQEYRAYGEKKRPVKFVQVSQDGPGVIKLHLARHGQGCHNAAKEEWVSQGKPGLTPWLRYEQNGHLLDAELTLQGIQEAAALREKVKHISPSLCVVSPLRRASSTLLMGFGKMAVGQGENPVAHQPLAQWVMHELARETYMDRFICDKKRSRHVIEAELGPHVGQTVWVSEDAEEDKLWMDGETSKMAAERCYRLLLWIFHLKRHKEVAIGSHSHILFVMLNSVVRTTDEELLTWFETGEMRTLYVRAVGDVAAEVKRVQTLPLTQLSTEELRPASQNSSCLRLLSSVVFSACVLGAFAASKRWR